MNDEFLKHPEKFLGNKEVMKQLAIANRTFFAKYYLGLDTPKHQREWSKIIDTAKRDLLLSPRDHGKSTIINYVWPVHEICKNRNVRILQISKTSGQAEKFLALVAEELAKNRKLIDDFGEFKSTQGWRRDFIFVQRDKKMKDPTLESCGVEGAITGGHFDIIIADDIIDEENTKTAERMENVKNWFFGTIGQLAEPHTKIFLVGTRKHYSDLYNYIMEYMKGYRVHIDKAIIEWPKSWTYLKDPDTNQVVDVEVEGTYQVLWPEKWGIKELLLDKLNVGSLLFEREKQNDPSGMRGRMLNKEWLQYYKGRPENIRMVVQGIDLAISDRIDADYFVIVTLGIDDKNNIYLLDYVREHMTFDQQVEAIKRAAVTWNPMVQFIERNAYQYAMAQHLIKMTNLPISPITTVKDKITRMVGLSPYFEQRRFHIMETMVEFIKEYLQFPKGEHDDILDALDLAMTEFRRSGIGREVLTPEALKVY